MELIVFDLDGTLLNKASEISPYTRETLRRLSQRGIAYTVATGRALHGAIDILEGHGFDLPQIFKNGVMTWDPVEASYCNRYLLTLDEIAHVATAMVVSGVCFVVSILLLGFFSSAVRRVDEDLQVA